MSIKQLKTCSNGHQFYKSSDCPVCPICENERKPQDGFLSKIGAPARRALEREGIQTLEQLVLKTEKELLALHGVGPNAFKKLKQFVDENGMSFKVQS